MQTTHALSDMRWAGERLGKNRLSGAYAWRALLDAGATVANGTDAPVEAVSSARSFYAAVAGPVPAMTRREALAAMTIEAARANFQEKHIGSIARGKYADFVMMDRDWMTAMGFSKRESLQPTPAAGKFTGPPDGAFPERGRRDGRSSVRRAIRRLRPEPCCLTSPERGLSRLRKGLR